MNITTPMEQAQHLVGRCLDIQDDVLRQAWNATALTVVSYNADRDHLSVHLNNGVTDTHVNRDLFWQAYVHGKFLESTSVAPFTNERKPNVNP